MYCFVNSSIIIIVFLGILEFVVYGLFMFVGLCFKYLIWIMVNLGKGNIDNHNIWDSDGILQVDQDDQARDGWEHFQRKFQVTLWKEICEEALCETLNTQSVVQKQNN